MISTQMGTGEMKEGIGSDWPVFGPYSPGVKVAGVIWLAGQIAPDAGDIVEQTQASLDKIDVLLAAAGVTNHLVTFVQVLLDDNNNFAAMNEIYCEAFGDSRPARSCVAVAALPLGAIFEVEAVVHVG